VALKSRSSVEIFQGGIERPLFDGGIGKGCSPGLALKRLLSHGGIGMSLFDGGIEKAALPG
jgi:hypothetical protein